MLTDVVELGWPISIILSREEEFRPLYPHHPDIGCELFLGRECDLGQGNSIL